MDTPAAPILIPANGYPICEQALGWTIVFAQRLHYPLHLALVVDSRRRTSAYAVDQAYRYLADFVRRAADRGVPATSELADGAPGPTLLLLARARHARYIALGCRLRPIADRPLLGRVVDLLVQQSPVPVLIQTPAAARPCRGSSPDDGPVVVPLDGSEIAELALPEAVRIARGFGRAITLVRAADAAALAAHQVALGEAPPTATAAYLGRVAAWVSAQGIAVTYVHSAGDAPAVIRAQVAERHALTIVIPTRGQSGLGRLVLGHVAAAVVRATDVPILLIGPLALGGQRSPLAGSPQPPAPQKENR